MVYYQHYQQPGADGQVTSSLPNQTQAVLTKAKNEITEIFSGAGFEPTSVLVATWVNVEPRSWWWWVCIYYQRYQNYYWYSSYYSYLYDRYCNQTNTERNTFQCVYATDGESAYTIVTYLRGNMTWVYDRYRYIDVGYTSPSQTLDYGFRRTDLTTKLDSNTFNTGRYGTWIAKVGQAADTDAACVKFFWSNFAEMYSPVNLAYMDQLYKCPCNIERLGFQWTWYRWTQVPSSGRSITYRACYYLGRKSRDARIRNNPFNKLCCYYFTYPTSWTWQAWREARRNAPYIEFDDPNAGHILTHDPYRFWRQTRASEEDDFKPKEWCCQQSSKPSIFCPLFNAVRPDMGCTNDVDWFLGRAMGDPHISTMDQVDYTFNGKGEYTLSQVSDVEFTLQGRTDQAIASNGNVTTATVFVAFAAKEGNDTHFQVELSTDKTSMAIIANRQDITNAFYNDTSYTFLDADLTVERRDRDSTPVVVASFASNIALEVYVGIRNLEFTLTMPTSLKGSPTGLMGNFNDNKTDDFRLPDGTELTAEQTDTDREKFENFGKLWAITADSSVFQYDAGESTANYQFPSFVPMFIDEVNQTLRLQAEESCGGADEIACVYDLLATNDPTVANATKVSSQELQELRDNLNNSLPTINLTTILDENNRWRVIHGQSATLQFISTDADGDSTTFELVNSVSGVSINANSGVLTYLPDYESPVAIGVQASDGKGKSTSKYVNIVVCTGCSSNGTCDFAETRDTEFESGRFLLATCDCWPAYSGDDCSEDADGCEDEPCSDNQECFDLSPAEQGNNTVGYRCGPCPDGYREEASTCLDTDECANTTISACPANSDCTNTEGSFICTCSSGYRTDPSDTNICEDINECAERTDDCQQVCENTPGNYTCSCQGGSQYLNADNRTCSQVSCTRRDCQDFCYIDDGSEVCGCNSGYTLSGDTACVNVNECDGNSPCSQVCTDATPGYTCSCYAGYTLGSDGITCEECESSYYGVNCASQCQCNGQGTCDRTRGCVCNSKWQGTNCVTDVDECAVSDACPMGQVCVNTIGDYSCNCPSGYTKNGLSCDDVDECSDILLQSCDLSVQDCANNIGSYSCVCREGYSTDSSGVCTDIDECTTGSHKCTQVCQNTEGSYNCLCYVGYTLNTDRRSCVLKADPCEGVTSINCDHICTLDQSTNQLVCLCNAGYSLVGTETCQDINECDYDNLNKCSYKLGCNNTAGSYVCSCELGSKLDNDGRTCVACGSGTWGENCQESCMCDVDGAASCDARFGCVCNSGFTGPQCQTDLDECTSGALICGEGEKCVNTRGSAECQCIDGYARVLGTCQDVNECLLASTNTCDQKCENYDGGYQCACYSGYEWNGSNCTDIDECKIKLDKCEQICQNSDGSYRCTCDEGLKLDIDGYSCIVASQCLNASKCAQKCADVNGVDTCFCDRGYELNADNTTCDDIDLCIGSPCVTNYCSETSDNTSFVCSCPIGQALADDGFTCTECLEGTYGDNCGQTCTCNAVTTTSCDKINGTCTCEPGWETATCADDIDECATSAHDCDRVPDSTCENTPGSFICKCDPGFYSNKGLCAACTAFTFGDECAQTCACDQQYSSSCDAISGACTCNSGWTGTSCDTDIDECTASNQCALANRTNWVCYNIPGSFRCDCADGYDDVNNTCVDIDECAASHSNLCAQNCTNTVGNYTCSCGTGYTLGSDLRSCQDIDECASSTDNNCQDVCTNTVGSYTCSCNTGRELNDDNSTCFDAYKVDTTLTFFGLSAAGLNLDDHSGADFLNMVNMIEPALFNHMVNLITGLIRLIILDLRAGSVVVDYTSVINSGLNPQAASQFTDALVSMAQTGVTVNGTTSSLQVVVGSLTVTGSTDKCVIMTALNGCADGETCSIDSSGSATCSTSGGDDVDVGLIVGLCVGIPLGLALIAAVVVAIWYKNKYKGQKRVNDRNDQYNENSDQRSSSPDSINNFRVDLPQNSLIDDPKNQ